MTVRQRTFCSHSLDNDFKLNIKHLNNFKSLERENVIEMKVEWLLYETGFSSEKKF